MSISFTEDIKTFSELEDDPGGIFNQICQTGRPVVVTVKGKAQMVLLDVETYERRLKTVNLSRLLLQAEADVTAGRTRNAKDFLKELESDEEAAS